MKYFIIVVQYTFTLVFAFLGLSLVIPPIMTSMRAEQNIMVGCTCLLLSGLLLIASAILYSKKE